MIPFLNLIILNFYLIRNIFEDQRSSGKRDGRFAIFSFNDVFSADTVNRYQLVALDRDSQFNTFFPTINPWFRRGILTFIFRPGLDVALDPVPENGRLTSRTGE